MKGMIYMNMRNLLNAGDFVMLVPLGIHTTLQYNASGNLEKVYVGFESDRVDMTDKLMQIFLKKHIVPSHIHITKGTSWVSGILYTGELFKTSGLLPKAVESDLLIQFLKNPTQFNFFAGSFDSTAAIFKGATPTRQCLTIAKFKLLPGWLVPSNMTDDIYNGWLKSPQYTFNPLVTDFIIYHKDSVKFVNANLSQFVVRNVERYVDDNGYVKAKVDMDKDNKSKYVDYSEVVHFNIRENSLVIMNSEQQIIFCKSFDSKNNTYSNVLTCPYCGKLFEIPASGSVLCPDIHCSSRLLSSILQFTSILNLPQYSKEVVLDWLKTNQVISIPDLFLLDEYKDAKVQVTITSLLRSLIPISLIPHDDVLMAFAIACTNNEKTFRYYIQNPTQISSDLGVHHSDLHKLISWLSDGCNISDLTTILNSPQICFNKTDKKFEGAPIFRNKTIFITGDFIRGSVSEIASILQSYSATVTTKFSNVVDCVLIGGKQDGIDGKSIRSANNLGTPIMEEDLFFKQYGIDDDLREILGIR